MRGCVDKVMDNFVKQDKAGSCSIKLLGVYINSASTEENKILIVTIQATKH